MAEEITRHCWLLCIASGRWKADGQFGQGRCFGADKGSDVTACVHRDVTDEPSASRVLSAVSADVDDPSD